MTTFLTFILMFTNPYFEKDTIGMKLYAVFIVLLMEVIITCFNIGFLGIFGIDLLNK